MRAIVAARTAALTHLQDQPDEHLRWISGCRTQPDDATAALLQGGGQGVLGLSGWSCKQQSLVSAHLCCHWQCSLLHTLTHQTSVPADLATRHKRTHTGMSDNEQELACLHADALMLSSRLQLKLGLCEAATKASTRQQRMQATLQKRDQQADIFGARTRKERRMDAVAVESAGQVPSSAPVSSSWLAQHLQQVF